MSPLNYSKFLKLWLWENPQISSDKGSQHPQTPQFPSISLACLLRLFALPELFRYQSCRLKKGCSFNFVQLFLELYVNWSQLSLIHPPVMHFSLEPLNTLSSFLELRHIIINNKKWQSQILENFISCLSVIQTKVEVGINFKIRKFRDSQIWFVLFF